ITGLGDPACLDTREFGGKAAGLASLTANGQPVAPGFAVGAAAYREFLGKPSLRAAMDAALTAPSTGGRAHAAGRLLRHLAAAPVPDRVAAAIRERYERLCEETGVADVRVAVRSSATAEDSAASSFAGEFE